MKAIANLIIRFISKYANQDRLARFLVLLEDASNQSRYKSYRKRYMIDKDFRFNGKDIIFYGGGQIICGPHSYIGDYSTVHAEKGHIVKIGSNCSISSNVRIFTANKLADQDFSSKDIKLVSGDVTINDNVWIGANVFVKEGVEIGANSVIGANAVVTKNIPAFTICGGVPAVVLKNKRHS